jgi:hypothetical protein
MSARPKQLAGLAAALLIALGAVYLLLDANEGEVERGQAAPAASSKTGERVGEPPAPSKTGSSDASPGKTSQRKTTGVTGPAPKTSAGVTPQRDPNTPLPKTAGGKVDFAALGMTGKESGAELLKTEEAVRTAPARYAFETGESWEVVSFYRQTQAGDGQVWSDPIRWRYEVEREASFDGRPCRVVIVRKLDAQGQVDSRFPASTFYLGKDDHRLLGADLYEVRGGKGKYTKVAYSGKKGPIRAKGSIVPFDLPENGAEGRVTSGRELPHLEPGLPKERFPQPGELVGAGEEALSLDYTLPTGGKIRQRWSLGDMRWPVESIGPHRRSYRVR